MLLQTLCLVSSGKKVKVGPEKEYPELQHFVQLTLCGSKPFCLVSSGKKVGAAPGKEYAELRHIIQLSVHGSKPFCLVSSSKNNWSWALKIKCQITSYCKTYCARLQTLLPGQQRQKGLEPSGGKSDKLIGRTRISRRRVRDMRSKKGLLLK